MEEWIELRRKIHNEDVSLRQISRETGLHRRTLRKVRDNSANRRATEGQNQPANQRSGHTLIA
jgi:hypothetical protein